MNVNTLTSQLREIEEKRERVNAEIKSIVDKGDRSPGQMERSGNLFKAQARLDTQHAEVKKQWEQAVFAGLADGSVATEGGSDGADTGGRALYGAGTSTGSLKGAQRLTKGQSLADWNRANGQGDPQTEGLNFGRYLKGILTGDWRDAPAERKALAEGTLSAGGYTVPTPLAGSLIDLVRNRSVVMQAGATLVPMTSQTLKIPRLTAENSPAWRAENALITDLDLTFDAVTFTARSLARLVKIPRELVEDSDPSINDIVANSFAQQLALELDRVALRGSGTAPEPRGVLNQSGITTTTHGANGAAIANYDFWLDAIGNVRNLNFEPNAQIQAPRSETSLSKLKEATTNAYLTPPATLANVPRFNTKQVPINLTVGTSTDCSEVYTAQWNMLGVGVRTGLELEVLRERYADNLQIGVLAHLRADIQLFHPEAFVVDTGVRA